MVCCFFGHREVYQDIEEKLTATIEDLIGNGVDCFLVGHQGAFDAMVLRVLRQLRKSHGNFRYFVVLAYMPGSKEEYPLFEAEESLYPEGLECVHPRYAISWRNNWLISESEIVVCYLTHEWGGAARFIEKARRKNKRVINIA